MSEEISREEIAALLARESMSEEMTREEAIRVMMNERPHCGEKFTLPEGMIYEAYNVAIAALEAEPCEDIISRKAAIEEIRFGQSYITKIHPTGEIEHLFDKENKALEAAVERIEAMPPVTPKQRTGHWVESYINQIKGCNDIGHFYVCTECGRYINLSQGAKLSDYPYCHCGAKMQEVEE